MIIKPIAFSYWRRIKAYARTFNSVPEELKENVKYLAQLDVDNKVITQEEYNNFIN